MKAFKFLPLLLLGCAHRPTPPPGAPDSGVSAEFDSTYTVNEFGRDGTIRLHDFNRDGSIDTLEDIYSGGSGSGGYFIALIDGRSGEEFKVNTMSSFGQLRVGAYIPPRLSAPENKAFFQAVDTLLPERRDGPDPSLAWIIYGLYHYRDTPGSRYFKRVIFATPEWHTGDFVVPYVYSLAISLDSTRLLSAIDRENQEWSEQPGAKYRLIYYGHNHFSLSPPSRDSFRLVLDTAGYRILATAHGLILRQGLRYRWLFISDHELTGSPQKLRWPSIGPLALAGGHYLILRQLLSGAGPFTDALWLIDLESGTCARFRGDLDMDDALQVPEGEVVTPRGRYRVEDLVKEVEQLGRG